MFCGSDGNLMKIYRCYNNQRDRIHFGSSGSKSSLPKLRTASRSQTVDLMHQRSQTVDLMHQRSQTVDLMHQRSQTVDLMHQRSQTVDLMHQRSQTVDLMHQRLDIIDYNIIPIFLNFFNLTRLKPRQKLILYILINIFLTITIINCSLNNPGPDVVHTNESNNNYVISDRLSLYYQNLQGLIPLTELGKAHPNLDNTKICELHAYVYDKKPDVIILNETWLKSTILDGEILPTDKYKIFRCNRTDLSHPPDPENASKFKKNGGGILIAVSCSLQLACSRVSLTCKAKLLPIEMIMNDTSKNNRIIGWCAHYHYRHFYPRKLG